MWLVSLSYKNSQTYQQPFPGSVALFPSECNHGLCVLCNISGRALSWLVLVLCLSSTVYIWFLIMFFFFCFTPNTPQRQASHSWPASSPGQTHSLCLTAVCQNQPSTRTHNINPCLLFEAQRLTSEGETGS